MRRVLFILFLVLTSLLQISWFPFLSIYGFSLPLVLLTLFASSFFWKVTEVLVFAFGAGIFLDFLGGGLVGSQSLALVLTLASVYFVRNLFLRRKVIGLILSFFVSVVCYKWILSLFV